MAAERRRVIRREEHRFVTTVDGHGPAQVGGSSATIVLEDGALPVITISPSSTSSAKIVGAGAVTCTTTKQRILATIDLLEAMVALLDERGDEPSKADDA